MIRSLILLALLLGTMAGFAETLSEEAFANPDVTCRPHTRWWWFGNALSKEDITWQLEQMKEQGIGGVEQITMDEVFTRGNAEYLSPEYFQLITHAVKECKRLGMECSLNFGGPGWIIGGDWVPEDQRSKVMAPTSVLLSGGDLFNGPLPTEVGEVPRTGQQAARDVTAEDKLLAVVAGRIENGKLLEDSIIDLSDNVQGRNLQWKAPEGEWRLMAFWLQQTYNGNTVDHFSAKAMEYYCAYLGGKYAEAFGEEFGKTVDSFFCDSFEVSMLHNSIYWSDDLLAGFEEFKGYDLHRHLPAIWWEVGELSPKIRYDVNEYLAQVGLEAFFVPFLAWCEAHNVQGRIQSYGFPTDILEGSGMTHLPEMEITAGEKDAVPWFDPRIGPKKYVASGAHLYGRNIVTTEAYTYLHWGPFRSTLEEIKTASDVFLRAGANKFYNHGYSATPERDIALSRRFASAEACISHSNTWWPYYHLLSNYIARGCYMLRQGSFTADIAIYSPLASQWTKDVRNARKWTRQFDWGDLGRLLPANGYDFDLINDDILQNVATLDNGVIRVRDLEYKVLLLPNIEALPLESLLKIQQYAKNGGTVIALEGVPQASTGLAEYKHNDAKVQAIISEMFDTPVWRRNPTAPRQVGKGMTYHIRFVMDRSDYLEWHESAHNPFLNIIRDVVKPDFTLDFVREDMRENDGLTHIHRKTATRDIYFVTNIQNRAIDMRCAFRVTGRRPYEWDPYTGTVTPLYEYEEKGEQTWLPLRLSPWASTFIVFEEADAVPHVIHSTFDRVENVSVQGEVEAYAVANGVFTVQAAQGKARVTVNDVPAPYTLAGDWALTLEGRDFPRMETTLPELISWTDDPAMQHFSGTGEYTLNFELPAAYKADDLRLILDLGVVGNIADVSLNGDSVGVAWMKGHTLDITEAVQAGENVLEVKVTNIMLNRIAGMTELPPVPEHLRERYGEDRGVRGGLGKSMMGFTPLPNSGLLGQVRILPVKRVVAQLQ